MPPLSDNPVSVDKASWADDSNCINSELQQTQKTIPKKSHNSNASICEKNSLGKKTRHRLDKEITRDHNAAQRHNPRADPAHESGFRLRAEETWLAAVVKPVIGFQGRVQNPSPCAVSRLGRDSRDARSQLSACQPEWPGPNGAPNCTL